MSVPLGAKGSPSPFFYVIALENALRVTIPTFRWALRLNAFSLQAVFQLERGGADRLAGSPVLISGVEFSQAIMLHPIPCLGLGATWEGGAGNEPEK